MQDQINQTTRLADDAEQPGYPNEEAEPIDSDELSATTGPDLQPGIGGIQPDGKFLFVIFGTPGKSKAWNAQLDVTFSYLDFPGGRPNSEMRPVSRHKTWPSVEVGPMGRSEFHPEVFRVGSPEWQRFMNGQLIIRVTGRMSWPNGYGETRTANICGHQYAHIDQRTKELQTGADYVSTCDPDTLQEDFSAFLKRMAAQKYHQH